MKSKKLKFTMFTIGYLTISTFIAFMAIFLVGMDLTNMVLGLATLLVVNVGGYSIINVTQKKVISENYRPELAKKEEERGEI